MCPSQGPHGLYLYVPGVPGVTMICTLGSPRVLLSGLASWSRSARASSSGSISSSSTPGSGMSAIVKVGSGDCGDSSVIGGGMSSVPSSMSVTL